jgi:PAS domain-containing protein
MRDNDAARADVTETSTPRFGPADPRQLQSILETSPLPIWQKSLDHRFVAVNGYGALMLWAPACDLVNESVRVVYSADTVE